MARPLLWDDVYEKVVEAEQKKQEEEKRKDGARKAKAKKVRSAKVGDKAGRKASSTATKKYSPPRVRRGRRAVKSKLPPSPSPDSESTSDSDTDGSTDDTGMCEESTKMTTSLLGRLGWDVIPVTDGSTVAVLGWREYPKDFGLANTVHESHHQTPKYFVK